MSLLRMGSSITRAFVIAAVAGACGGANAAPPKVPSAAAARPTGPCSARSNATPLGKTSTSSSIALARIEGRSIAFVADEDAKAILTFDLDTQKELAQTPLAGAPGQLWVATDGRVFTTLRDKNQILVLRAEKAEGALALVCQATTAAEPIAIAPTPDERTIVVTAGWGGSVRALDTASLATKLEVRVPREPRGVVVSDDGKMAFVSHAVGSHLSAIDLVSARPQIKEIPLRGRASERELLAATNQKRSLEEMVQSNPNPTIKAALESARSRLRRIEEGDPTCQGFVLAKVGGRLLAPEVMVDPGDLENRPAGYGDPALGPPETPSIAVLDGTTGELLGPSLGLQRHSRFRDPRDSRAPTECLLPRAAAVDPMTKSLLVACLGADAVIAYDATSATPAATARRTWPVGAGPSGIAIDEAQRRAVVFSQFDRTITTFALLGTNLVDDKSAPPPVAKVALAPLTEKLPPELFLGRMLFHAAGDPRISGDGRACASCHPDGRDDAITWATPQGPRRSIPLAGRISQTAPYSWDGNESSLPNHLATTFDRLKGQGLKSFELDALVAYISKLPEPPARDPNDGPKRARGKEIFASKEAGCASCHSGPTFTDGRTHDVGSKHKADRASVFNTPSLHLVGGSGPFFHDGRYRTLPELLKSSDGKMGHTNHLSSADIDALASYVESL